MPKVYSIFQAKTHLSELLKQVKNGKTITITERGRPLARVVPINDELKPTLEQRLEELSICGQIKKREEKGAIADDLLVDKPKKGALNRFLKERE